VIHVVHNSLTTLPIAGPWRRSRRGSSRRPDGIDSLDLFTQRTIKKRPLPGGWTSIGSSISSTCVPPFSVWPLPTVHFQTELAIATNADVSDVRRDVTNVHTVVANTHSVVSNTNAVVASTHTLVSDIYRNILQSQGGTDGQPQPVSDPILRQRSQNSYYSSDSSQVSDLE
jgi:hypothetical protein